MKKCPICKKNAQKEHAPFCSRRCADADLGNWISGKYAVPGGPTEPANDNGEEEE